MYTMENLRPDNFKPAHFEGGGSITLNGREIPYKTISEDNVFYDKTGKPIASIFSYSYFRTDVEDPSTRPVLFGFNGGPGSCSMHVHAGFLGTKRVVSSDLNRTALPPYEVIDNEYCLLDIADIVLVDPVATGYGLLIDESASNQFFGIEADAESLLYFIEKWLHKYNRWLSPKYLIGESYGCTRNAVAAGLAVSGSMSRSFNIAFDGIVMIGNTVSVGEYFNREVPVEPSVLSFPTYAAINWYHNHPTDQSLEEFTAEAKEFADNDYQLALYKGGRMSKEEKQAIMEKVHYYSGASMEYLTERDLRIDDKTYRLDVLKDRKLSVGRYDARVTRQQYEPALNEQEQGIRDDATSDHFAAYFRAAVNGAIFPMLNINLDRTYVTSYAMRDPVTKKDKWNREAKLGTTAEQLRSAMVRTPGLRVFFANGWYDMATFTGVLHYTLDHANLPMDRVAVKHYASGHMIYISKENCEELCSDIRSFINGGMPEN